MNKLANSLEDAGYIIKEIKEESYGQFDRPSSGEKYTGEIILKIRSAKDEEAEAEKIEAKAKAAKAAEKQPAMVPALAGDEEQPF
jgi:hypothetical protein